MGARGKFPSLFYFIFICVTIPNFSLCPNLPPSFQFRFRFQYEASQVKEGCASHHALRSFSTANTISFSDTFHFTSFSINRKRTISQGDILPTSRVTSSSIISLPLPSQLESRDVNRTERQRHLILSFFSLRAIVELSF